MSSVSDELFAHDELFHYTTFSGVKGILESQCLYATHFAYLNDRTEINHFKESLSPILTLRCKDIIKNLQRSRFSLRRKVQKYGGLESVAEDLASSLTEALFKTAFDESNGLAIPFITSFCSHKNDRAYERKNGLLSQWRGYGGEIGFCLVFDWTQMEEILKKEGSVFAYARIFAGDVEYSEDVQDTSIPVSTLLVECEKFIQSFLDGERPDPDGTFEPLLSCAALFKHHAFREEREVRIIACPQAQSVVNMYSSRPQVRPIFERRRNGQIIPTIKLFDGLVCTLPIKRIIVGPGKNQDMGYRNAIEMVDGDIEVVKSETPYIGM